MRQYLVQRILATVPTLVLISMIAFGLMHALPGDVALLKVAGGGESTATVAGPEVIEALRSQLGLDKPLYIQYAEWVWKIVGQGDLGVSFWSGQPVTQEILERLPITIELALGALVVSLIIAIPAGMFSAVRQDTGADYVARVLSILGIATPNFWIGTMLIIFPAIWLGYLHPFGYTSPLDDPLTNLRQFAFPWLTLGAFYAATAMRMTRSQMLEVLRQDYIRTARAKGLRERSVLYGHALKNSMIPVLTILGVQLGALLSGTVTVEAVYALPGLGTLLLNGINQRDYPLVQGVILLVALIYVLTNLLVDIAYAWLDPRIRYA